MEYGFDDTLFEGSSSVKSETCSKCMYAPKQCEQEWFSEVLLPSNNVGGEESYMPTKFKADLLYRRKDYLSASITYEKLLSLLPNTHSQVRREIEDSLVRCWLALGRREEALSKARQLTLAPHERDVTAWLLLSNCHHGMGNAEDRIVSLLRCASLQRYHHLHWTQLSSACRDFCDALTPTETQRMAELLNPAHETPDSTFDTLKGVAHTQSPCFSTGRHVGECFSAVEATPISLKPFVELVAGLAPVEAVQSRVEQSCLHCQLSLYATFSYAASYWCLLWAEFLLGRATKHAESFARGVLLGELEEVQRLMGSYCWCASHVISQLFISVSMCDNSQS
ncbi:hypothetical protein EMCRGX_G026346 [Ephydatia muelleri]